MDRQPDGNPVSRFLDAREGDERERWLEASLEAIRQDPIIDQCMSVAWEWRDRAIAALHETPADGPREELTAIAEFVTQRDF